jgi:hypothetical protein
MFIFLENLDIIQSLQQKLSLNDYEDKMFILVSQPN